MHYVIALIFYSLFYGFAYLMGYMQNFIVDVLIFLLFLLLYRLVLNITKKAPIVSDVLAASALTLIQNNLNSSFSMFCFFFLMFFICFESFTYTYLNTLKSKEI